MSCYIIYYRNGAKMMRQIASREEYVALRNTAGQQAMVSAVRNGKTLMKRRLLQFNYSCIPGPDMKLKGCQQASDTVGMDVDHIPAEKLGEVKARVLAKKDELGLLMLELSARGEGYHLVFRRRRGMSQEANLRWASKLLGVDYDAGAKDITRVFFATTGSEEDLIYLDDGMFATPLNPPEVTPLNPPERGEVDSADSEATPLNPPEWGEVDSDASHVSLGESHDAPELGKGSDVSQISDLNSVSTNTPTPLVPPERGEADTPANQERRSDAVVTSLPRLGESEGAEGASFGGVPYPLIVRHLETLLGGRPEHGARNNHIFAMACNLRYICNHDAEWVIRICPTYGEDLDRAHSTIRSACNRSQSITMSDTMARAIRMASAEYQLTQPGATDEQGDYRTRQPAMPKELPDFVREAIAPFPDYQQPALALACFTPLMAYFSGVRFRYIDNTWMEPSSMFVLAGGAGKGKGGHKILCDAITRLMKEQDEANKLRDEQWKRDDKETADNRKHKSRPDDICYQKLCGDVTTSALTQRQGDCFRAGGKFIYSYFSEASMLKGVANDLAMLVKIAYDCDERGAARSSSKGESGEYPLRWNFSVSCNKTVLHKTFNFNETLHDGTLQRLTFALLPERKPEAGARGRDLVPRYHDHDEAYDAAMRRYAEKVQRVKGDFESPEELTELSFCRCDDKYDIYQNADDQFFEDYGNRTIAIAHKIGFTLWVLNDMVWTPEIATFTEWAFWYMMWAKCVLLRDAFYATIEGKGFDTSQTRGPRNMLTLLRNQFTYTDLLQLRRREQKSIDSEDVHHQLAVWLNRGHIKELEKDVYEKVNFRSQE